MPTPTVLGVFDRPSDAEKLREELLHAGVARHRIVVSRFANRLDDPIVGQIPDPRQPLPKDACVVSVAARSHLDKKQIAELMRRYGARGTHESRT